jgi:RNA recognition motif-containing protein
MGSKLYVANLPDAPSAVALREHFSACGPVADVQIVPDRNRGRGRGSAVVRMSSAAGAERALSELNGSTFAGQLLLVEAAPDDAADRHSAAPRRGERTAGDAPAVRITSQYREAANMTYELDCSGVVLVIRVSFPSASNEWRIVVQKSRETDGAGVAAVAASRIEAFRSVVRACCEGDSAGDLGCLDWRAVEKAMLDVRAL